MIGVAVRRKNGTKETKDICLNETDAKVMIRPEAPDELHAILGYWTHPV